VSARARGRLGAALLATLALAAWAAWRWARTPTPAVAPAAIPAAAAARAPVPVHFFFAARDFGGFEEYSEEQPLPADEAQQLVALARLHFGDPRNPFAVPPGGGAPPLEIYRAADGTLYVDLGREALPAAGSLAAERAFFQSLASTLLAQCGACARLRFLVDGRDPGLDELHLDLTRPFSRGGP
jgi:hypothetical protein